MSGFAVDVTMKDMQSTAREPAWKGAALVTGGFVVLLWLLEIVDTATGHPLDAYGIRPRSEDGLVGVVLAPTLHFGFDHLVSNATSEWLLPDDIEGKSTAMVLSGLGLTVTGHLGHFVKTQADGWTVVPSSQEYYRSIGVDLKDAQGRVQLRLVKNLLTNDIMLLFPSWLQRGQNRFLDWRRRRTAAIAQE